LPKGKDLAAAIFAAVILSVATMQRCIRENHSVRNALREILRLAAQDDISSVRLRAADPEIRTREIDEEGGALFPHSNGMKNQGCAVAQSYL
jgi:hypothetical protein